MADDVIWSVDLVGAVGVNSRVHVGAVGINSTMHEVLSRLHDSIPLGTFQLFTQRVTVTVTFTEHK